MVLLYACNHVRSRCGALASLIMNDQRLLDYSESAAIGRRDHDEWLVLSRQAPIMRGEIVVICRPTSGVDGSETTNHHLG